MTIVEKAGRIRYLTAWEKPFIYAGILLMIMVLLGGCGSRSSPYPQPVNRIDPLAGLSPADRVRMKVLWEAESQIGVPYMWGGESPEDGFDCSGLVYYCYLKQGIKLPRTTSGQKDIGLRVPRNQLRVGDLVLFKTRRRGGLHVGLYAGNDTFIHAPKQGKTVEVERLDQSYYQKYYYTARRII